MVTLPSILDMNVLVHSHLIVRKAELRGSDMRWNREISFLAMDLVEVQLVAWTHEGMEYANFLLKAHSSKTHLAQVTLLVQ